ncbi:alpha/beta hydrolase family protein [Prosthecobacter vanneervenii]|uniref:Uncharacterized protein n=1 Tax=Prosthecobacter vanneervenii TaxID=48466 RepID=A0A7W7YAQ9_9BACT|nr:hypothetical protein [Prosthecobacter vanneervenii]MBB5032634.1 hypothetical protein [Prosthecobacter vanneervenii]
MTVLAFRTTIVFSALLASSCLAELPDIRSVEPDLTVPALSEGAPSPGKRVKLTLESKKGTGVYNVLYLPTDWKPGVKMPVIVELAGNGGFTSKQGDVSHGVPEGSNLGYGLTAGKGFIWLCVPYLNDNGDEIATLWWGTRPTYDPQPTLKHLRAAVQTVCSQFGGDPSKVLLCGFSRGAIACNYLGLHDDETARLWCGFFAYSHYDGVRKWPYPNSDRNSALTRLQRLGKRPQFICGEGFNAQETEAYLRPLLPDADLTFLSTGFLNHNDAWTLRPSPAREQARKWLMRITNPKAP